MPMSNTITSLTIHDIRFPTSRSLDGSDAMNPDPDYSATYVVLGTSGTSHQGHGLTFTIGRGNEVVCAAVEALRHLVIGQSLESFQSAPGAFWRHLTGDSQLRWIGPDKGAVHLATAAVVNGMWMPRAFSSLPSSPARPRANNSAKPPTTGGSTTGNVTSASKRALPRIG